MNLNATLPLLALCTLLAAPASAQRSDTAPRPESAPVAAAARSLSADERVVAERQSPSYPLTACLVCNKAFGEASPPESVVHNGRLVMVCDATCAAGFAKDAPKALRALDEAVIAAQAPSYPFTTCVVTGDELKGKPKHVVVGTRLIEVCCGDCKRDVQKDATAALAKIDAALIEAQARTYPSTRCAVDDKPLGEKPVRHLHGVTLVQACSAGCVERFRAAPAGFLRGLEGQRKAAGERAKTEPARAEPGRSEPGRGGEAGRADPPSQPRSPRG